MSATHLYFDSLLVGEITNTESDFPSFSGEFNLTEAPPQDTDDVLFERIRQYIDLCVRQDTFYSAEPDFSEQEEETDDDENNELELSLAEEENKYLDLIHSNSWKIMEAGAPEARILTPLFGMNKGITWKLNLG